MTTKKMKIDTIWQELLNDQSPLSGLLLKRYSETILPDLFIAVRYPEKLRCIALNIDKVNEPDVKQWTHLKDIKIEIFQDNFNKERSFFLILLLNELHCDVFSVLCEDLIFQVAESTFQPKIINLILNRLSKWENLFDSIGQQGLSNEAQRGLYGELYFLRKFLISASDNYSCLKTWTGPSQTIQDFQNNNWALEVKTTHGNNHQKIHISSERQLDDSIIPELYLFHISLDVRANFGETLNDIVFSITEFLLDDNNALSLFNIKLHEAGYFDIHRSFYSVSGYSIRQENIFAIKDKFPRIRETELLPGVGDVKYSIIISDCQQYVVTENDLFTLLTI